MNQKCRCCLEEKPFTAIFFPSTKIKEKIYLEKICKKCKQKKGQERRKERYKSDPAFRKKKMDAAERCRLRNQKERNAAWQKRGNSTDKWKKNNPEKVKKAYSNKYKKYMSIPKNRINCRMKNLINSKLREKDYFFKDLNYSVRDLRSHLEKLFKPGMSWDNRSEWHIDHIQPLCSFDIKERGDEEFQKCWSLSNLQPLWRSENSIKGQVDKLCKIN